MKDLGDVIYLLLYALFSYFVFFCFGPATEERERRVMRVSARAFYGVAFFCCCKATACFSSIELKKKKWCSIGKKGVFLLYYLTSPCVRMYVPCTFVLFFFFYARHLLSLLVCHVSRGLPLSLCCGADVLIDPGCRDRSGITWTDTSTWVLSISILFYLLTVFASCSDINSSPQYNRTHSVVGRRTDRLQ